MGGLRMQNVLAQNIQEQNRGWLSLGKWSELYELITPQTFSVTDLLDMREQFARSGYVKLPNFLTSDALQIFKSEMDEMEQIAIRKQFEMPGYNTPRKLSVLGGASIKSQSPLLYSLYHHYALRSCIESIVGRPIYTCNHKEEFMVANFLLNNGDTHGWHLDDPSYALIIFADAPSQGGGGEIEFISNWTDLCKRKGHKPDDNVSELVSWAKENGLVDEKSHHSGDAYLLRADLNLHRVKPLLKQGERRSAVNLAFQSTPNAIYGSTANLLYCAPENSL